ISLLCDQPDLHSFPTRRSSDLTGTPTETGVTNPHTVTGLSAATDYDFYVQADCGGDGTSIWSGPFTFTTACDVFTVPFYENFENGGTIPNCWEQGTSNSENWIFSQATSGNHVGDAGDFGGTLSGSG